ncbi:MAG: insulinase family protein [Gemmatimonadetes bacterium]|nr:insulinase family protein [Gemmatimonadota bacterium]
MLIAHFAALSRVSRALLLGALLVAAPSSPVFAQDKPSAAVKARPKAAAAKAPAVKALKGATVEGITEYRLPNGLIVLLFPDATKPTATVNATYFVGSRHEAYGETGMAHLLEHLLFKGTPEHPNIPQELTERGARPNGTTWYDRTNYFETFPATDENLAWALDLEASRMVNSFVAKKDLDSEMTVVRNEFEAGENYPFVVLLERAMSTAFLWHNYGKSTIGARSDIENVPIDRLQAFYRKYYQPDNAMLVVAGKFDEKKALELIEQKFGRIPRPKRTGDNILWPTYTAEPTQDGERLVTLRRVGDLQVVNAVYHVPPGSHEDYAAIDILTEVLGDSPSGRLYKALVETRKAATIGGFNFQLHEPGALIVYAEVRTEDPLDSARVALTRTIDDVVKNPPTAEEVDRARTKLLKEIELTLTQSDRVGLQLSEWASIGDWRLLFLHRDRLKKVSPADVQRVAAAYLKPSNRTLGLFYPEQQPERAEIPAAPDVAALVKDYRGDTTLVAGEAFDPSPANIDARTTRSALPNGFKLALLPKKTRGEAVIAQINLRYGSDQALQDRWPAASLAGRMLMRGTRSRTRQQLEDEFDRLKARVFVSGGVTQATVSIETVGPNLPAVLRLMGEVLREPAFDAKEFGELKQERLANLEEQKSDPQVHAFNAFSRHLGPWPKGHARYTPTVEEEIAATTAVTLEQARHFYLDFYGANAGEMAVVGDFDAGAVANIAGELFGSWKSTAPFVRIAGPYRDVEAANISIETPDKPNAWLLAGLNLNLRDDDPDYAALVLGNYMMGGGFLNSRLATRLRQKDGLSYGVGSFLSAHAIDRSGTFGTYAIYAPENAGRVETGVREELERALRDGFNPDEVQKAKEGYLQSRQVTRAQDRSLASMLSNALYLDRTLAFDADLEKKIAALTPQQVLDTMRRHIDPRKISVIKAGDFAAQARKAASPKE